MKHNPYSKAKIQRWTVTPPAKPDAPAARTSATTPAPASTGVDDGIRFGYTLNDLDRLARSTVNQNRRWFPAADRADQYDAAWHGIAQHLCSTDEAPSELDLLDAGREALAADQHANQQTRGARHPGAIGANFARYWLGIAPATPSPEGHVVDRVALPQIWPLLAEREQQALIALAWLGDYETAAKTVGLDYKAFGKLVGQARRRFYAAWHEGETAPTKPWRRDVRRARTRGSHGRARLTVSEVDLLRERYDSGETVTAIAADAGVSLSALSALLRGTSRPAADPECPAAPAPSLAERTMLATAAEGERCRAEATGSPW